MSKVDAYTEELEQYQMYYRRAGYPVQVVQQPIKHPWPVLATFPSWGAGFFVIDVDEKDGGWQSIMQLRSEGKTFPPTVTARTGGGGMHLYYRYPKRLPLVTTVSLFPGIDLMAESSRVFMPPSFHYTGNRYRWLTGFSKKRMAEAPEWLIQEFINQDCIYQTSKPIAAQRKAHKRYARINKYRKLNGFTRPDPDKENQEIKQAGITLIGTALLGFGLGYYL